MLQLTHEALLRFPRALAQSRGDFDIHPARLGDVDHFVQIAGPVLDLGRGVRGDALVEHRFVIEAGQHRHGGRRGEAQPV